MLRRKLTRIQLNRDDMQEYENVKKQLAAKNGNKSSSEQNSFIMVEPRSEEERIAEVHRRIGYKPEVVPSDGTERML